MKDFVELLGSKYDIKHLNRIKKDHSGVTQSKASFMDELINENSIQNIKYTFNKTIII